MKKTSPNTPQKNKTNRILTQPGVVPGTVQVMVNCFQNAAGAAVAGGISASARALLQVTSTQTGDAQFQVRLRALPLLFFLLLVCVLCVCLLYLCCVLPR